MLAVHLGLLASVVATLATTGPAGLARLASIGLGITPLAVSLPCLLPARRAGLPWLAVALVLYSGFGSVEVIAKGTLVSAALFFCALLELGLVLALIRLRRPRSPDATAGS